MSAPTRTTIPLDGWGPALTCYTAALASHLSDVEALWWRPLVAGSPYLAVELTGEGPLRFDHHPAPLAQKLGLRIAAADSWPTARSALYRELDAHGRVVVAADAFALPWLPSFERHHSPHWYVLRRDRDGFVADDALELLDARGSQGARRTPLAEADLFSACRALVEPTPVQVLRERAALGGDDVAFGRAYRWLEIGGSEEAALPAKRASPGSAVLCIARHFGGRGLDPQACDHADDVWQALRQRELVLRAFGAEGGLGDPTAAHRLAAWTPVVELWRRLPPLLLHAQMLARRGSRGRSAAAVVEVLEDIARVEDALVDERFSEGR